MTTGGGHTGPGVVHTDGGAVRGVRSEEGIWRFLGVPYAGAPGRGRAGGRGGGGGSSSGGAPAAGRFAPPGPPAPWKVVRPAHTFGPICPQPPPSPWIFLPGDPVDADEECRTLNVWTAGPGDGAGRPVMVWLHGGAFVSGTASSALYDGTSLARRGAVVVTVNYRLGALGFLAHPALAEGDGPVANWGLLDQLAALDWVRRHAEAFGGDPANVTVFGESAGAMSIAALLASPLAVGRFDKAIVQSGPPHAETLAHAAARAERIAADLGVTPDRTGLRGPPAADLVTAQERVADADGAADPLGFAPPFLPVVDGHVLAADPLSAAATATGPAVPLLVGTTADEASYFAAADPRVGSLDDAGLARLVERAQRAAGEGAPGTGTAPGAATPAPSSVVAAYRAARQGRGERVDPATLWTAIVTDAVFRLPSLHLADVHARRQARTYVYRFTWPSPLLDGILGACHSVELPFVFGTLGAPRMGRFAGRSPEAWALSGAVQDAWVAFATGGDPSCPAVGDWPAHDPVHRPTMELGARRGLDWDPGAAERAAWSA